MEQGDLKAQMTQGKDNLIFLIDNLPLFYKEKLSFWNKVKNKYSQLFNRLNSWTPICIQDGRSSKTGYILRSVFENQDFKQIIKKSLKKKNNPKLKSKKTSPKEPIIEKKAPLMTAPMLYTLNKVKIDKSSSFEDLREIATKYLKLEKTSADFYILAMISKRLEELQKDLFGKKEQEALETLNIKYQNANIPKLGICLKQIKEASSLNQKYDLLKIALRLPQDASFKMIQTSFERVSKQLSNTKDPLDALSLKLLDDLMKCFSQKI